MRIPRQLCRHPKKWTLRDLFRAFFIAIISISIFVALILYFLSQQPTNHPSSSSPTHYHRHQKSGQQESIKTREDNGQGGHNHYKTKRQFFHLVPWEETPIISITSSTTAGRGGSLKNKVTTTLSSTTNNNKCSLFTCFDIHRCGSGVGSAGHRLSIYLYPLQRWEVDGILLPPPSKQFLEILDALRKSIYWVADPSEACILIPTIDTLFLAPNLVEPVGAALASLPFWGQGGGNHLLFTLSSHHHDPNTHAIINHKSLLHNNIVGGGSEAIVASSAFPISSYRPGFNIPLIFPNPFHQILPNNRNNNRDPKTASHNEKEEEWFRRRKFIAISPEPLPPLILNDEHNNILVLDYCAGGELSYWERCNTEEKPQHIFAYPQVLKRVDYCIIWRDLNSPLLFDAMSMGCIPVILADFYRLPFDDVIDWSRVAILVYEQQLGELSSILRGVGERRRLRLKAQVELIFNRYFKNVSLQAETVLEVLQDRIFSHHSRTLQTWNNHPTLDLVEQPLFNPASSPGEGGFTAVILAYERVPSLFQVISQLDKVPSLSKIIVVWNNQKKRPPIYSSWPKTNKSIKVIQMSSNKMSNRFFPFDEIETEAVFSLDDDIIMLTTDEVEFGFQTWKEFPERLVGFPSRNHVWDNSTKRWRYESEWTNEVSMVLTGAAFYHKYWNHAFSHEMPEEIRTIVDDKMNCEDIAINFLVSATTGQPPIKVTPRKKFKCPSCSNNEMLSSDSSHMMERSDCMNKFAEIYGHMPLLTAEWRADPVLYRNDVVSSKLKKYKDVGTL